MHPSLLILLLPLLLPPPARPQHLENDLQSLLHDLGGGGAGGGAGGGGDDDFEVELIYRPEGEEEPLAASSSSSSSTPVGVRRLWGVEDTQAFIGRLFSHAVPQDAFQGDVEAYQVKGLPAWLAWDAARSVVEGVARPSDRGHHYVTIHARGTDGSRAKDVFAIEVVDLPGSFLGHEGACSGRSDVTVLSVLLDAHLSSLSALRRLSLLRAANKFLGLNCPAPLPRCVVCPGHGDESRGLPWCQLPHDADPLAIDAALQAGPGSAKLGVGRHGIARTLSQLQWVVGCNGDIRASAQAAVDRTEVMAKNGNLQELLGVPVLGWHVTQVNPKVKPSPEKPTRILEASPTVAYESAYPTGLPYPNLEGSIVSQPSATITTTTPLTATTTASQPGPVTTQPIAPSSVHTHTETETGMMNSPPRVKNRIPKLGWTAGHVYRLPIPSNTFEDFEDGDTRNLDLHFKDSNGKEIGYNSWIQFNTTSKEIYALPLEKHIGHYTYLLEAMDRDGKIGVETVKIHVQQPKEGRNYNHRFSAVFKTEKTYEYKFVISLNWQVKVVEKIAQLYGDPDTNNINVRAISTSPTKLTWTNTSLTDSRSTFCPTDDLEAVAEVVVGNEDHGMTREVKEAFRPEFQLMRVHIHYMGHCEVLRSKPGGPRTPMAPPEEPEDGEPIMRNPIDLLNATAGTLLRFQVPEDTCYDLEDGDSHKLKMRLLTANLAPISPDSWLQFDSANHEFFGVPLTSNVGKTEYNLECVDKGGKKVIDALFVNVLQRPARGLTAAHFSITLQHSFREFMRNGHLKARLVERIATVFGDPDPRHVAIDAMKQGSVVVTWHNSSLPGDPCPEEEMMRLRKVMMDDDGNLLPSFVEAFAPEYRVVEGRLVPAGVCLGGDTPTHVEEEEHQPPVEDSIQGDDNDYLINFIIPAVIIAAMLLLAAVIACCLYRRRRYGKMTMADDRTFVSKGIPIIFAEELDDRPDPAKSPVIMKEEKPPLPPPEYQRGTSPAASATPPPADRRRPQSGEGGDDAPSYQPPPPFTATNGASRHPRPNMPPTYRKPPTYVPP
ncbi:hypothetical protein O3P69_012857 [Scylla paramamosain]|uniref:Dystroglycan 1 n=1 Tax=Scylla paramamosain TaxID=85552 RepID=A0AAW0TTL6_SCYPA